MRNANEVIQILMEEERKRIAVLEKQLKKGCQNCSQWDEYWGCDKCERMVKRNEVRMDNN